MKKFYYCIFLLVLITACSEEDETIILDEETQQEDTCDECLENISVGGVAQKGPFLNGSSVSLFELNTAYTQTGNAFNTQISNNLGDFQFTDISLATPYAVLRADGFYFNEVCGENSASQITLNGIAQIRQAGDPINLNVLTHLEKPRVEYLLQNTSLTFDEAKEQAQTEILNIFNITPPLDLDDSETFNIANNTEGDAILIAVSSILQGYRTEAQFSTLLADITTDISEDGILNSDGLGRSLFSHAAIIDANEINTNIETRFEELGITVTTPDFETYITNFLNNTTFPQDGVVVAYPAEGLYGVNLLNKDSDTFTIGSGEVSVAAALPTTCLPLRIKISKVAASCDFCWGYSVGNVTNWAISAYDQSTDSQLLTSTGLESDVLMIFQPGTYQIEYFESFSNTPTSSREITLIN